MAYENRYRGGGRGEWRGRDEDRGFFERAGDEVRSWFGYDEDYDRPRRERRYGRPTRWSGEERFGGGWGNQNPRSERLGGRNYRGERDYEPEPRYGYGSDEYLIDDDERYAAGFGGGAVGYDPGFGGPRFDRLDPGSTGTHGVHPVASAFGTSGGGAYGERSSARRYARAHPEYERRRHDPHYAEWRQRRIDELDRDYEEYRREHQSRFEREFGSWRERRSAQRRALDKVTEHMEVIGSDGEHVGTVDKVRGEHIVLTKSDPNASGVHHGIPCSWIETVEDKVKLNRTAEQAMDEWRQEERSRALFEREDSGSEGPRILGRSFSGTYSGRDER